MQRERDFPNHTALVPDVVQTFERCHWQTARSVEHVEGGWHQYVVRGWDRDDVTVPEFDDACQAIRIYGRRESWTPPAGFYSDERKRRPMRGWYLYVLLPDPAEEPTLHAVWHTWPRNSVSMLNREPVTAQLRNPTRTPDPEQTSMFIRGQ